MAHYRKSPCPICGDRITNNALGRAAHIRHCKGGEKRVREVESASRTMIWRLKEQCHAGSSRRLGSPWDYAPIRRCHYCGHPLPRFGCPAYDCGAFR